MSNPYQTLGFVENNESNGRTMSVSVRLHNGANVDIPLEVPSNITRIYYNRPSQTMVAHRDETIADAPIILEAFTRAGIFAALQLNIHPTYRRFTQWEFDRYFSMNHSESHPDEFNWNSEVYRAVTAYCSAHMVSSVDPGHSSDDEDDASSIG